MLRFGRVKEIRIVKSGSANSNGQKDVRMSPLAIANMMATIARGGEKMEVKAVEK